jgi:hypothetical protein
VHDRSLPWWFGIGITRTCSHAYVLLVYAIHPWRA